MSQSQFAEIGETLFGDITTQLRLYGADTDPEKVESLVGVYKGENGQLYNMRIIPKVERKLADEDKSHGYSPGLGEKGFRSATLKLALGNDCDAVTQERVGHIQSLSGTGGLRLAFEFLKAYHVVRTVFISEPTWEMHHAVLEHVGYTDVRKYKYLNPVTNGLDLTGMLNDFNAAPEGSIIIMHVCCHNPTGIDLNQDEWKQVAKVASKKKLLLFFDMAYGGLVSGDPEIDAWPLRYFIRLGLEVLYCQSFSKIFGLYGERCGTLGIVCKEASIARKVEQKLLFILRRMYLCPPQHGARIVSTILNNNDLYWEWRNELNGVVERIKSLRLMLFNRLQEHNVPGDWSFIVKHNGMLSLTGLTKQQLVLLREKHHIYLLTNSRMNVCSINRSNVDKFVKAVKDVIISTTNES